MTPEKGLTKVMAQLTAAGIDPIAVWSTGPDDNQQIHVRVRSVTDRSKVLDLDNGWLVQWRLHD